MRRTANRIALLHELNLEQAPRPDKLLLGDKAPRYERLEAALTMWSRGANPKDVHFLAALRAAGCPATEYPFCTTSLAYESVRKYVHECVRHEAAHDARVRLLGPHPNDNLDANSGQRSWLGEGAIGTLPLQMVNDELLDHDDWHGKRDLLAKAQPMPGAPVRQRRAVARLRVPGFGFAEELIDRVLSLCRQRFPIPHQVSPAALGSDTGGSLRIPAALTGITGLKTTTGLIRLHGAFPLSGTLDSIGPMTRDALDAGLLTQVLSGEDANDPRTRDIPAFCAARESAADLRGARVSVLPVERFPIEVAAGVLHAYRKCQGLLTELGAIVEEVAFPFDFHDLMLRNGSLIAAEAFATHRTYIDDEALAFGSHVRRRIQAGRGVTAADYIDALAHHRQQRELWPDWMQSRDALLTPTLPMLAPPMSEVDETATPLAAFTRAAHYLGACGVSLPGGFAAGLPIGMQLLGGPYAERTILDIAATVQSRSDWHRRHPPLR